nr:hypothetical protein BDOA9_0138240 [Bradyrhizobium sp. DOA9]
MMSALERAAAASRSAAWRMRLALCHQLERRSKALRERQRLGMVNCGKGRRDSRRSNREQGNYESQTAHVRLLYELDYSIEMGRLCFRTVSWARKLISLKQL